MDYVKISQEKLSVEDISNLVSSSACGAISLFVGTTRENSDGKNVVQLEYEAYESMALKYMKNTCGLMRLRWPEIENIAIFHRVGVVPIKEASVVIAVSSPHRLEAMLATQWCIDKVKQSVPIWKKEVYADESPEWRENKECAKPYPPRKHLFKLSLTQPVTVPSIPLHLVQIKASGGEIEERIQNFITQKREEVNAVNVRNFCGRDLDHSSDDTCARRDATLIKRKDSKGHLEVSRILNTYQRDRGNLDYLMKYIPKNGVEERLSTIETKLNLHTPVAKGIYLRIKQIENRLSYLEGVSPEYPQIWGKDIMSKKMNKKRTYSIAEIDTLILQLKKKKTNTNSARNVSRYAVGRLLKQTIERNMSHISLRRNWLCAFEN